MTRRQLLLAGAIAAVGAVAIAAWLVIGDRNRRQQLALGQRTYAERCAACHGKKLEGQPDWQTRKSNGRLPAPPHDASGHTWHHADRDLFTLTKDGMAAFVPNYMSDMPAYKGVLTDDEILAVLAFIKSTWPDRERKYQEARTQAKR